MRPRGRTARIFRCAGDPCQRSARAAAADGGPRRVHDALLTRGEQISLDAYHGMTCGAVTGSPGRQTHLRGIRPGERPSVPGAFRWRPRLVRSALQVSTGWPILASTIQAGVLSEDLQLEVPCPLGSEWLLTQRLFFRRIDDAIRFTDGHAQTSSRTSGRSHPLDRIRVGVKKARESAAPKKQRRSPPAKLTRAVLSWHWMTVRPWQQTRKRRLRVVLQLQGFNAIEFVVPGTRFYLEFRLDDTRIGNAGVGLFLQALRQFIIEQNLGGWTKNGFGRFEVAQVGFEKLGSDQREQPPFRAIHWESRI